MKISLYLTLLTMTGAAVCTLALPRNGTPAAAKRDHIAASDIDYTPTGSNQAIEAMKILQRERLRKAARPAPARAQSSD